MDNYRHPRFEGSNQGRENKIHRKKGFGVGVSSQGSSSGDDGEKKPKFVSYLSFKSASILISSYYSSKWPHVPSSHPVYALLLTSL